MNFDKHAIAICGPTAIGKTKVAISIAQWLKSEIVSFDSRQFFRELKIGSAPPNKIELSEVKHHFIASHNLGEDISAGSYANMALEFMKEGFEKYNQLVLVGGSGLYMKALTEGFDDIPSASEEIRSELNRMFEEQGLAALQDELASLDPEYYDQVDRQNPQRLIRALEVIRSTGKSYSSFRQGKKPARPFNVVKLGIDLPREELYERINQRVDQMIASGLEEEVASLKPYWEKTTLKTVGYDELVGYFRKEVDRPEAIEEIKRNTRRYAKRQLTWFRRDKDIQWFRPDDIEGMKAYITKKIQ